MKQPMWYAHECGFVRKVGNNKDDLIDWLMGGFNPELYVFSFTKEEAIKDAKARFGSDWEEEFRC